MICSDLQFYFTFQQNFWFDNLLSNYTTKFRKLRHKIIWLWMSRTKIKKSTGFVPMTFFACCTHFVFSDSRLMKTFEKQDQQFSFSCSNKHFTLIEWWHIIGKKNIERLMWKSNPIFRSTKWCCRTEYWMVWQKMDLPIHRPFSWERFR